MDIAGAVGPCCLLLLLLLLCSLKGTCQHEVDVFCFRPGEDSDMNCTWTLKGEQGNHIVDTLYYRSLKLHKDQQGQVSVPRGQNWVVIARENFTKNDKFEVWVKSDGALGQRLEVDLETIVIPRPPVLHVRQELTEKSVNVMESVNVLVSWDPEPRAAPCELQYREHGTLNWTQVHLEEENSCHCEYLDLSPFTQYDVRAQFSPSNSNKYGSDWSEPITFLSLEAAPLGKVDVWRSLEDTGSRYLVMWKALDPKAARSASLSYKLSYWEQGGRLPVVRSEPCCNASLPSTVESIVISAVNSLGATEPSNLTMKSSDLPAPAQLRVQRIRGPALNVSWVPSEILDEEPQEYLLEWRLAEQHGPGHVQWERCTAAQGLHSILLKGDAFQREMPYNVSVYALYQSGIGGPTSCLCYIKEGVPSSGPPFTVHQLSATRALVTIGELPLSKRRGLITHYTLYVTSKASDEVLLQQNVSDAQNVTIPELEPGTLYLLNITASTSAGESPSFAVSFMTPGVSLGILVPSILVTVLVITICVLAIVFRKWIRRVSRAILPKVFWQKIPDPMHSTLVLQMPSGKDIDGWMSVGPTSPALYGGLEEPAITEVEELEVPLPVTPAAGNLHGAEQNEEGSADILGSSVTDPERQVLAGEDQAGLVNVEKRPPVMYGYEKHFMPSL